MIIRSFSIDRFGLLAAQRADTLSPGLNIFYGHNEAGKSTLLNFFRAMFFGYKRDNKNALDYTASAPAAALSGGNLMLSGGQGAAFNLIRRPGPHGGVLTLTDDAGRPLPESYLAALLSNQTDKMYDQVFCFGHNDLASLAGMKEPQVSGALHAAAFGTGFRSPLEIARNLRGEQEKIFAPRASTRPMNQKLKRLAEVRAELARAGSELGRYSSLKDEQSELEAALAELRVNLYQASLGLAKNHSLLAALQDWLALREVRSQLLLHPHPGGQFGLDAGHISELASSLANLRAERKGKILLLEEGRKELSGSEENARLAALWPDCQALSTRLASVQSAVSALPRLEASVLELRERQEKLARGLGWSLEKAGGYEITLALHSAIDAGRQNMEGARRKHEDAEREQDRLEKEAAQAEGALKALRIQAQAVTDDAVTPDASAPEAGNEVMQALYTAEARLKLEGCGERLGAKQAALELAEQRLEELEAELHEAESSLAASEAACQEAEKIYASAASMPGAGSRPPLLRLATAREDTRRAIWLVLSIFLALLCFKSAYDFFSVTTLQQNSWDKFTNPAAWGAYLAGDAFRFGLGCFFIWGALYWLNPRVATLGLWKPTFDNYAPASPEAAKARSRADALSGECAAIRLRVESARKRLEDAQAQIEKLEKECLEELDEWRGQARLYSIPEDLRPAEALKIFDAAQLLAHCSQEASEAAARLDKARSAMAQAKNDWKEWLLAQEFDPDFTPETIGAALERIREIQRLDEQSQSLQADLQERQAEVQAFRVDLATLLDKAGEVAAVNGENGLLGRFNAIYKTVAEAHEKSLRRQEQEKELKKLEAEIARLDAMTAEQEERFAAILAQGGASDEADYRLRFEAHTKHRELRLEEERLLAALRQAAGQIHAASGEALWQSEEFLQALEGTSGAALQEQVSEQKEKLEALERDLAQKQERQGEIRALLEGLTSGQGGAALQAEESALKEELRELGRRWGVLALSGFFLGQARKSFEEERHDSVIRQAGEILGGLTGGRYRQMLFDLGGKDFKAYAVTGDGESRDSESSLSQGTREQLYLALRLAFIRQHNLTKEPLPLIMDDILVNFDPERAGNAASLFADFAASNQTLFFTCHPHTVELLREISPQAALYRIENGRISAES